MKNSFIKFIASVACVAITLPAFAGGKTYGKKFSAKNARPVSGLAQDMGTQTQMDDVVLEGEITQVCQAAGCWIKMKNDQGAEVFVKFRDHAFLVPKDIAGRKAVIKGTAIKKTVSVEERRHLAEDAGASEEEIAKITEPKEELRVEATGIIVE